VALLCCLAGCGRPAPLAHTFESAEAAAAAVLDAYARGDRARLLQLAVSEGEFRTHVWPELPAARPERNLPLAYVWSELRQKSDLGLATLLARHAGQRYSLLRLDFSGRTRYPGFVVHRRASVEVRDDNGRERRLRLWGSMIEQAGRWKVFSYVVDE
jgi:hypothetical protein